MSFRVLGLDPAPFRQLFGLSDDDLAARGARRYVVDKEGSFPDRIELRDLRLGERALLLNYTHQPDGVFYTSSHAIFVREGAEAATQVEGVVPDVMRVRPLSLRAFDARHEIIDADVVDGAQAEPLIARLLANPATAYIHAHYAKRGCYAARIERLES